MASDETIILKLQTLGWGTEHRMSYHTTLSIFSPPFICEEHRKSVNYSRLVTHCGFEGLYKKQKGKKFKNWDALKKKFCDNTACGR